MTQIPTESRVTTGAGTEVPAPPAPKGLLDAYFKISARGSTLATEVRGGLTTFMAMAYIIVLNPILLSGADINGHHLSASQVTTATALAAAVTTIAMGLIGNVPLAAAAGLGVSAALSTIIVPHCSWSEAFGFCVIYGALIVLMVVSGLREKVMNGIPLPLKHAITMGIGLFIAFIGLVNAGFVGRNPANPVQLGTNAQGHLEGWPVALFAFTLLLIFVLQARKTPGAILIGIVSGTVIAVVVNALGWVSADAWGGPTSVPTLHGSPFSAPNFGLFGHISVFGAFSSGKAGMGFISASVAVFTLVLAGFFDAMATIIGVGTEAGLADEQGRMPGLTKALLVDGAGGMMGGLAGASGNTVFVESATGVGEGARTGLASVVTGGVFALMLFFSPLAQVVPGQVAAAALVVVGSMMMAQARHIPWADREIAIPAFLMCAVMPMTYSITAGVGAGVVSYVAIKAGTGKWRAPGGLLWGLTVVFLVYFFIGPIQRILGVH
ncbi:NCS2 family permease [Streptacidiphilus albus]|uniref:NCS2 family permease n=1 Tax=Streptacidiphilus albus TaxID=105425 RepID=UPI0005A9FC9E